MITSDCQCRYHLEAEGTVQLGCGIDTVSGSCYTVCRYGVRMGEGMAIDPSYLKPVLFEFPAYMYLRTGDAVSKCLPFKHQPDEEERIPKGSPELTYARKEEIINACEARYRTISRTLRSRRWGTPPALPAHRSITTSRQKRKSSWPSCSGNMSCGSGADAGRDRLSGRIVCSACSRGRDGAEW